MRNLPTYFLLAGFLIQCTTKTAALVPKSSQPTVAATQELHQEIKILLERLEKMEAKHDTLEAAAEQFRLKAKSIKDELNEEKSRYNELMLMKIDIENRHTGEIASFKSKLWDAGIEISKTKENLELSTIENERLKSLLLERDRKTTAIESENAQLLQELMLIKEQLDNLQRKSTSTSWHSITESELGSTILELFDEYWDSLKDYGSYLIGVLSSRFATLREYSVLSFRITIRQLRVMSGHLQQGSTIFSDYIREKDILREVEMLSSRFGALGEHCILSFRGRIEQLLLKSVRILQGNVSISEFIRELAGESVELIIREVYNSLLQSVIGICDKSWRAAIFFWQQAAVRLPHSIPRESYSVLLQGFLSRVSVSWKTMALLLEWLAVAIGSYHITNLKGSHSHWFYRACMSVKFHSGLVVIFIAVALGLLFLEIALMAFNKATANMCRPRTKVTFHKQVFVPLNGTRPTTSLLRTSLSSISRPGESESVSGYPQPASLY